MKINPQITRRGLRSHHPDRCHFASLTIGVRKSCLGSLVVIAIWVLLTINASVSRAQDSGTDGVIDVIKVQTDGAILIGGSFEEVAGVARNGIARLSSDGSLDQSFIAATDHNVRALAVQPDGKIILGGDFTQVNGVPKVGIARLNSDGSLDFGFSANTNGSVSAIVVQNDGKLLLGGSFAQVNGDSHANVARLNNDGSLDPGFGGNTSNAVNALAIQNDGKMLLGGTFSQVNGAPNSHIARLNANGSLDTSFSAGTSGGGIRLGPHAPLQGDGTVYTIAVQSDGKVLVGGRFTSVNGTASSKFARLNGNGSLDQSFSPVFDGSVSTIAVQTDGKMLLGGYFGEVNSVARVGVARLNPDGSLDSGFKADTTLNDGSGGYITSSAIQSNGGVLLGGSFDQVNGAAWSNFVQLSPAGLPNAVFRPTIYHPIRGFSPLVYSGTSKGQVGQLYNYHIVANFIPKNYGASGLPAGLIIDSTTGLISGTPSEAGTFPTKLSAAYSDGTAAATLTLTVSPPSPPTSYTFFSGQGSVGNGVYYLTLPNGAPFGYYSFLSDPRYFFHFDLGYEFIFDAKDGRGGIYLYDFASDSFFYTSPSFPFPYLYDFKLKAVLYYYSDTKRPGRYTSNPRYFLNTATGQIISK